MPTGANGVLNARQRALVESAVVTGEPLPAEASEPIGCEFRILGPLEISRDGVAVGLPPPRAQQVLVVLLLHANRVVSVDRLCDELWQEHPPESARSALHVHIAALRRALGPGARLHTRSPGYLLQVDDDQLDARLFENHLRDAREALTDGSLGADEQLRWALALWRGPPLAEFGDLPCARDETARLLELRTEALEQRIDADLAAGRHSELVAELHQLVTEYPYRERLHGQLMLALYRAGRQADALDAYRRVRQLLVEQLGVEPGTELRDLHQAILAHDPALEVLPAVAARLPGVAPALPAAPNALFGREVDLQRLARLVPELSTRLITMIGPGGVGKTRLAVEVARQLAPDFTDGAHFVELAATSEPRELASVIARALSARVRDGEPPKAALVRFLEDRRLLLILDNFEHLMDGAPLVAELLTDSPHLTVLVTSREPTRLAAERLYPVRPLDIPGGGQPASAVACERYAAVAMFCDRARARDPDFALDDVTAPHVSEICRRLDGLPLALELAAARIGTLSAAELAARLDRALTVLVAGSRDSPERHRTLRATIDWSYGLLSDVERHVFACMAAFASGARVATAESVTGATLDTLDSLVAKQLLVHRNERLVMLETVRDYARERLGQDPDVDAVHNRLAAWCLCFTREATPHLVRAGRAKWLARLDAEYPNVLAALSWALDSRETSLALELASELGNYWWRSGRWADGLPLARRRTGCGRADVAGSASKSAALSRPSPGRTATPTLPRGSGSLAGTVPSL